MHHIHLKIPTADKSCIVDLTERIHDIMARHDHAEGICTIFVSHTTACIAVGEIGEGTEKDFLQVAREIIPALRFRHAHDPSHAWSHMAASLIGPSLSVPFADKQLLLGTWQRVMLVELDGPRERTIIVSLHS